MITATIGKIFLGVYNKKYGKQYDAKTFFVEVYHPLFFDQNKYLMTAGNTPLENPKISWADMIAGKKPYESKEQRNIRFNNLMSKFEIGFPTTENSLGFGSTDINSTTSGQTTNLVYPFKEDDIYYSWYGVSLGIGVQGGLSILFSEPQILMDLFEGWKLYRMLLSENDALKGNQVNTWNGQWLAHVYDEDSFYPEKPLADFNPFVTTKNGMSISTLSWTKVLIGISKRFDNPKLMGYVYNLGQTNTTVGFIPFSLDHIRKPIQLYSKLFGADEGKKAEDLWGTETGFRVCCQNGIIGIDAMQPKGLRSYLNGSKKPKKVTDEEQKKLFNTYIIWIIAMLNNQDLWSKSMGFAHVLLDYSKSGKNSKTVNSQRVNTILAATNKKSFISALTEIVGDCTERNKIVELAEFVNTMPTDNVPYFLTLLKFCYASIN